MTKSNRPPRRSAWEDDTENGAFDTASESSQFESLPESWGSPGQALSDTWSAEPASDLAQPVGQGKGGGDLVSPSPASFTRTKPAASNRTVEMLRGIAAPQALADAPVRPKRVRKWDQAHAGEQASFRGIPDEVHEKILWIADDRKVPLGYVVRCFLEYGEQALKDGNLQLVAIPNGAKMALFEDRAKGPAWYKRSEQAAIPRKIGRRSSNKKKKSYPAQLAAVRTYRGIPRELQDRIRGYAKDTILIGDVVRKFLEYALEAYEKGLLDFTAG